MGTRLEWLRSQPFTLGLSAGFFGFFAHAGFLSALEEVGVRPRRVVGVSAGALAGGVWASNVPAARLGERLCAIRRGDFWDPGLPLGGLLKGERFGRLLQEMFGAMRVEEMPLPFAAVAHDIWRRQPVVLERGSLERAVRASCAVPFMFRPVKINGAWLVDGGVTDRNGFAALAPDERLVMHYLPSSHRQSREVEAETAAVVTRPNSMALVAKDQPRLGPFRLEQGPKALELARARAAEWLQES